MNNVLLAAYVRFSAFLDRTRRDEGGFSELIAALLMGLLVVIVITAAVPVVRERFLDALEAMFDSVGELA